MESFLSELIGLPIISEKEGLMVGRVADFIINPYNGMIAGISLDKKSKRVIPAIDIRIIGNPMIISTIDAVSDQDEIIKIRQILRTGRRVLNNKVFTKSGDYLGRVYDYAIHRDTPKLTKIAIAKSILGIIQYNEILLPDSEIIEITPEKIIVQEGGLSPKKSRETVKNTVHAKQKMRVCAGYEAE